jgi:hypothetical protein
MVRPRRGSWPCWEAPFFNENGRPTPVSGTPLTARIAAGLGVYRQLGPRRGTAVVGRFVLSQARGRARAVVVPRRPISVSTADVSAALGGRDARTAVLDARKALPTVGRAITELDNLEVEARDQILAAADRVLAHEFDLLGSGLTPLGATIDWHRDFKSGRGWPLAHISRIVVSYPDGSDIKVPWELSRCQHLPLLALASRLTGDRRYIEEIGAQTMAWIETNPVEVGVNWACTMDAAIRAINWVAALSICADDAAAQLFMAPVVASLLLHARFIRANLEYGPARGNHYLSDVVGLLLVATVFQVSDEGQAWIGWAIDQLGEELAHQVRADGCDHEASTSYHRLVTELFVLGADAADALMPGRLDAAVRPAIARMLRFVADYTRPDGLAPQLGDADDGRILPLGEYGSSDQRSHLHLFAQADAPYRPATESAAYPAGGFYVLRGERLYVAVRCGDVGIHGRGCHSHNDLLAFELSWGSHPLVVDPGSYLYTADPAARNQFRSTAAHAALQVDDREQNEVYADRLFAMADRARPEVLAWDAKQATTTFKGTHRGFTTPAEDCVHTRTLRLDGDRSALELTDELVCEQGHSLTWRFPLAPCQISVNTVAAVASFEQVKLTVRSHGTRASIEPGWLSPSYGVRVPAPVLTLRADIESGNYFSKIMLEVTPV